MRRQLCIPVCRKALSLFPAFIPAIAPPSAAGYRLNSSGALTNVGTNGYVWSSSSYYAGHNNAGYLNFNSGAVNPLNNANRANAFSVRCVQHLSAAFYLFPPAASGRPQPAPAGQQGRTANACRPDPAQTLPVRTPHKKEGRNISSLFFIGTAGRLTKPSRPPNAQAGRARSRPARCGRRSAALSPRC